jgi:opacity protein-like surface antigen
MFNKFLTSILTSSVLVATIAVISATGATAQSAKKNYIGPSIGFGSAGGGSATLFGVNSKFGVADSVSIRPYAQFGSVGGVSITSYGATATYDFNLPQSELTPYAGIGYGGVSASAGGQSGSGGGLAIEFGADYNVNDSVALNASYRILNISGASASTFNIGGGFKF